jgi:GNAT superfamily N-acetyltransferase
MSSDTASFAVRPAHADDTLSLAHVERQARIIFYGMAGLGAVAELPPATPERLRRGPCWVAHQPDQRVLGFILADRLDDDVLLETLAVLPEFSGGGIGRALVNSVIDWTRETGAESVVVAAYRDLPWDAPFYARLGFQEVPHRQWTTSMHRLRREASAVGHDATRRLWMRLKLE